jgi:hypothetical protein
VIRQGYAGLLWSKQFYHYMVADWLTGDSAQPPPPSERQGGRNREWGHVYSRDIISMPDKWEYPWFAAWDLAFHMIPMASVDPDFAKQQLTLLLREWYMHPNGQIPAYEFAFGDVNPPVHAWAAWRVYKISGARGQRDRQFLESVFQKLLLNFTWWVNRKDMEGNNLFQGGFLGLDNIGVFDRSLLVEALERYHHFYGDTLKVECLAGSGRFLTLGDVATELSRRLGSLFLPNSEGARPCHGTDFRYVQDPNWRELVLFYEYFHADTGRGCGASHQTGWTSLAVRCLEHFSEASAQ